MASSPKNPSPCGSARALGAATRARALALYERLAKKDPLSPYLESLRALLGLE
jgi:hypothetical protein